MTLAIPAPEYQSACHDNDVHPDWGQHASLGALILGLTIVDLIWLALSPVDLDWPVASLILLLPLTLAVVGIVYIFLRPAPSLGMTSLAFAELFAFSVPGVTFSCLMTSLGRPMMDDVFAGWDKSLHFDWVAYVDFIAAHPWLNTTLALLYASSRFQICLLIVILNVGGRHAEVNRFIGNLVLGAIVISIIGGLMPALGGYAHYGMPERDVANFAGITQAFHSGAVRMITLTQVQGIITFPSYHAAMSVAIMLASRSIPYLRYPAFLINAALIAGVPVHGAHYLVDIIAGAVVILIVNQFWRRIGVRQAARSQISFAN